MAVGLPHARTARTPQRLRLRHLPVALVVLALIVRVGVVFATPGFAPRTDSIDYDRIAVSLADHGSFPDSYLAPKAGPTAFRAPLFPLVLAGVYDLSGTANAKARWRAGRLLEALLGALVVALIYAIAKRLWGARVAATAGLLAAVYPPLVLVGSSLMSESVFIPLVLGATLSALVHAGAVHRWRWALLTGVLVGLAALARGNGIALVLPIGLLLWDRRPRRSWQSLASPVLALAAVALTLAPWTLRNEHAFHRFVPVSTETGFALAGIYNPLAQHQHALPSLWAWPVQQMKNIYVAHPDASEAEVSSRLQSNGINYIEAHPASLAKTALWSTLRLLDLTGIAYERVGAGGNAYPVWLAELSVYAFWLTGLVAIAGALTLAARRAPKALWAVPLVIFLSSVPLIGATRYRSPADPFVVLLAALGLGAAHRRLTAHRQATDH